MNRPCSAVEAVARAVSMINHGTYVYGTGDFQQHGTVDEPWTQRQDGMIGSDCAGLAICYAYKLTRHRPGFNVGPWASVSDDINCNSAIEDADHHKELFERITVPEVGALLTYPTFRSGGKQFIGHVAIVVGVRGTCNYSQLDVVQCCGPTGRKPGVLATDGHHWDIHDSIWPKPQHRSVLLQVRP